MITVRNLCKRYGSLEVLKGISTEIRKGEVVSIIGPSGCGKSTFLRCLNLLETPSGGDILINGTSLLARDADVPGVRQRMNMVFQSFNLFAHLTVLENLTLGPIRLLGKHRQEAEAHALELLRLVGLAEKADRFPDELSGGQKQRVAIARCLAMDPEIILFDEPTSALDPTMVREVLSVIRRLAKEGMTMIIVTHEMDFARDVSQRIFYMDEGGIHEEGTPAQIFESPQREKTRAFINRVRSYSCSLDSPDFDFYALNADLEAFCEKQILPRKARHNLLLLVEELLQLHKSRLANAPLAISVSYSEKTEVLELQFEQQGSRFNPLEANDQEDDLGLILIRSFAEDIAYTWEDGLNRLVLAVRR
ncbi:MAG: hypothetical protein RL434_1515 [Pseudomonadota bacterium]